MAGCDDRSGGVMMEVGDYDDGRGRGYDDGSGRM